MNRGSEERPTARPGGDRTERGQSDAAARRPAATDARPRDSNQDIRASQRVIASTMASPQPPKVEERITRVTQELFQMKRQFKSAKLRRERREIMMSAKKLVYSLSIDPSTQDEKSVALLLNTAAFFDVICTAPALQQAITWMTENVSALEPRHVAMFSHAVVALKVTGGSAILSKTILPTAGKLVSAGKFTPVELIMLLQAIAKSNVHGQDQIVKSILDRICENAGKLKTSELSTVCTIFDSAFIEGKESAVKAILTEALAQVEKSMDAVHSNDILLIAEHLPPLASMASVSAGFWSKLLSRAIAVAGFFGDRQLPHAFRGLREMYKLPEIQNDAAATLKMNDFRQAIEKRLDVCKKSFNLEGFAELLHACLHCQSSSNLSDLLDQAAAGVVEFLNFARADTSEIVACVKAIAKLGAPFDGLLGTLLQIAAGTFERKARISTGDKAASSDVATPAETPAALPKDLEESIRQRRENRNARSIVDLTQIRVFSEIAYDTRAQPEALTTDLPRILVGSVPLAHPEDLLSVARLLYSADGQNPCVNTSNNSDILQAITKRAKNEKDFFRLVSTPGFLESFAALEISGSLVEEVKKYLAR